MAVRNCDMKTGPVYIRGRSDVCLECGGPARFASGPIQYDEPANHEELACKLHYEHRWWRHVPESGEQTPWNVGTGPEDDCYFKRHRRELARRSRRPIHRRATKRLRRARQHRHTR
jgi:hypothetical protein